MRNDKKNNISKTTVVCAIETGLNTDKWLPFINYPAEPACKSSGNKVLTDKDAYITMLPLLRDDEHDYETTDRHLFALFLNDEQETIAIEEYKATRKKELEKSALAQIMRTTLILKAKHVYLFTNLRYGTLDTDNSTDNEFVNILCPMFDSIGTELTGILYLDNYIYQR